MKLLVLFRIVPLLPIVMFPQTFKFFVIERDEVIVPFPMVSVLQAALVPVKIGWNAPVKLASPMMASIVDVGTPAVQFEAVCQLVLVVPFHDV